MSEAVQAFKPLGAISIIVGWLGLIFMIRKWPGNKSMAFSNHAAATRSANVFYGLLFSVILPPLFLFFAKWFVPALNLPRTFIVLAFIACFGQLVAAWVPTTDGLSAKVHTIAALTMHMLLLPMTLVIAVFANITTAPRVIAIIASAVMLITWYLFRFVESTKKHILYVQAAYVGMFHITVLAATYLR